MATLKERLRSNEVLRGVLTVIPSPVVTQAIASAGADFVVIDREHGPIGLESMQAMITATAGTACAALVRVPKIDEAEAKSALDAGADGIVFPLIRDAADVERCVSYVTYPPVGRRGFGPFVAHSRHQTPLLEYLGTMGPEAVCGILLETAEAVDNIDEILRVPGLDFAIAAPFDLSTALGVHGQFDAPVFVEALTTIERAVTRAGIPLGGAAFTAEQTAALIAKGHRILFQGFDVLMLKERVETFKTWS
jgi:4-hydroxy-2-oxoheptanedioate aldolase